MNTFAEQGYQVFEGVFAPEGVVSFRAAIMETVDRMARAMRAPFQTSRPDSPLEERLDLIAAHDRTYGLALFRAALADAQRDPRIEAIAAHAGLCSITQELLSPRTKTGQTIRARAAVPAYTAAQSPWHQDVVRETNSGCGTVRLACWIPLRDVDQTTGALEVVPGVWDQPRPHVEDSDGSRFYIKDDDLPLSRRRAVPLRAGDVLVLDRFIPHRSLPVIGNQARWAVVMWVKGILGPEAVS